MDEMTHDPGARSSLSMVTSSESVGRPCYNLNQEEAFFFYCPKKFVFMSANAASTDVCHTHLTTEALKTMKTMQKWACKNQT